MVHHLHHIQPPARVSIVLVACGLSRLLLGVLAKKELVDIGTISQGSKLDKKRP
jgi:hypothetical protein